MFNTETADADYTLARMYEEGTQSLTVDVEAAAAGKSEIVPKPKATYEVAEGVVGTMPFPRLGIRERIAEITAEYVHPLFQEEASGDDIRALSSEDDDERAEAAQKSIKKGISSQEFTNRIQRSNCLKAVEILEFDGEVPDAEDINPEMASVVTNHFTALRPGTTNGRRTS